MPWAYGQIKQLHEYTYLESSACASGWIWVQIIILDFVASLRESSPETLLSCWQTGEVSGRDYFFSPLCLIFCGIVNLSLEPRGQPPSIMFIIPQARPTPAHISTSHHVNTYNGRRVENCAPFVNVFAGISYLQEFFLCRELHSITEKCCPVPA